MIAYILPGIVSGILAAIVAFLSGAGLLLAFVAYVVGGMVGMVTAIVWMLSPPKPAQSKHSVTQRS